MMYPRVVGLSLFILGLLVSSSNANAWTTQIDCEGTNGAAVAQGGANHFSSVFSKTVYSNEQAASGSQSCKMGVTAGTDGWSEFGAIASYPAHVNRNGEVWVRLNLFIPNGFNVTTNTGVLKFMRLHTFSAGGANEGYHDLLIGKPGYTFWDTVLGNVSASFVYNFEGFAKLIGVGVPPTDSFQTGKWESYEMYVKFDSVSKDAGGQALVRVWHNNKLLFTRHDQATLKNVDSYSDAFFLFTYWNGNAPATQSLYVDDIVMTSETPAARDAAGNPFIGGKLTLAITPSPPTSVSVQ